MCLQLHYSLFCLIGELKQIATGRIVIENSKQDNYA